MATVHKDIRPSLGFESDTTEAVRLGEKATVHFTVTNNGCNNANLAAGASCTITVRFRASNPTGAKSATLRIVNNSLTSPKLFGLTGTATA